MASPAKQPSRPVLLRMPESASDAELVERAVAGDRWSREVLYKRHARSLLGMTARLLGRRDDAEEIVQDTFVMAFEQLQVLREPAALRAWLGQIAISLVRRRLRRARLTRLLGLDRAASDATLEALAQPGASPDARTELALLDGCLSRLRAQVRIAWMLRHVEGFELTEVASLCGCSLATVKRRLSEGDASVRLHVGFAAGEP
jgi:RNA polymerase sigma-70 factor (ECF subfamily)